jgi:hypothetical protein
MSDGFCRPILEFGLLHLLRMLDAGSVFPLRALFCVTTCFGFDA